ncbi:hypothetical protein D3C86_1402870 [compost metagenome]
MVWIRLCLCIGLSIYIVSRKGTSKPVNHISTTIAILKLDFSFLNWRSNSLRSSLVPNRLYNTSGSSLPLVMTILIRSIGFISFCSFSESTTPSSAIFTSPHSGRISKMFLYNSKAMGRLLQTNIAFPFTVAPSAILFS